jgi:3-isopropylmalate/(R)-2-methylmalate dehydratase small subunit
VKPVRVVAGAVAALDRASVDTDQIIPKQFLKRIERTGYGEFLFDDWMREPDFPLRREDFRGAPILATGRNFGCGSSREHAAWALQDFGFQAIVAESFADIFATNCGKNGLLTVELPADAVRELLDRAPAAATVDLEAQRVTLPSGREVAFEVDPGLRERLLNGWDDIALTERREDEIARYEAERERDGPDVLALPAG